MANSFGRHIFFFVILILFQVYFLNALGEIGNFICFPIIAIVLMLPQELGRYSLIFIAFLLGVGLDFLFHSGGLYSSSFLIIAFFRKRFLDLFAPRDGYEINKAFNISDMGYRWFLYYYGSLSLIFSLWFHILSWFSFGHVFTILYKTIFSAALTLVFIGIGQIIIFKSRKSG